MASTLLLVFWLFWLLAVCHLVVDADTFDEQLIVRPLDDGRVLTHFQFVVRAANHTAPAPGQHHYLLSPTMAQIVEQYEVASLRLSLTQGTWFAERWGYPLTGEESAGSGAELWAQLRTNTQRER
ncbi:GPI transamidase component PIG-T [Syncephalis pseudoplumigaleata]|uniref:GPI transamidase component PIG-T n=1 Tax=Syncephalis pseudoplumigaleata TaxID=1712513 RepID=A0A4P9YTW0_9FUNG|nr:GPI transamidase component PIG-T [Syncephalis pseudoplumigaleata]|eukprot:RKP22280.1 GPI transamidase component PIG-T [Syncephalis pseudoplumigaleata]